MNLYNNKLNIFLYKKERNITLSILNILLYRKEEGGLTFYVETKLMYEYNKWDIWIYSLYLIILNIE
jgi:hypothetical protein